MSWVDQVHVCKKTDDTSPHPLLLCFSHWHENIFGLWGGSSTLLEGARVFFLLVSISHEISRGAGEEQRWEQRLIVLLLAIYFEMASFLVRTSHVLEEANQMVVIRRVQFLRLRVALKWPRVTVARSFVRSEANSHYNVNFFFFL